MDFRLECLAHGHHSSCEACSEVRFSEVMSVQSSRSRNTTQLVCWTGRLWGLTCCNTVCPSARWPHTITHSHTELPATQAYDQHAPGWHKQTRMVAVLASDQTWTRRHTHKNPWCKWTDIPAHKLRNTHTHTIPRAQYRNHYFGMPHCFLLNTACTQNSPGLSGVSNTGLQQTDMIA